MFRDSAWRLCTISPSTVGDVRGSQYIEGYDGLPRFGPLGSITLYSCMSEYMVAVGGGYRKFSDGYLVVGRRKKEIRSFEGKITSHLLSYFLSLVSRMLSLDRISLLFPVSLALPL